jgi:DNA-directed RNA polymerase specialized sigma24 family protein
MGAFMPAPTPPPEEFDESVLAGRLVAALREGDHDEAKQLKGEIIGLHYARLQLYVEARLRGRPAAHAEDVFSAACEKIFVSLGDEEKVGWVVPGETFAKLFFRIAKAETADYWRGRPPYKDYCNGIASLDSGSFDSEPNHVDCIADVPDELARMHDATLILETLGGFEKLDGLLLHLNAAEGIELTAITRLFALAAHEHVDAATAEAAQLLGVKPELAAQYLTLVRECPGARPMSYNNVKTAACRARQRARRNIDPDNLHTL